MSAWSRLVRSSVPIAIATGLLIGLAGCSGSSDKPAVATSAKPTPIERLNTAALRLDRTSFCTRLPEQAVRDAVDGSPGRGTAWRNGDRAEIESGLSDVVHEYGCRWTHDQTTASAWLFARPLDTTEAQAVIDKTAGRTGCRSEDGPGFGEPSQRQTCTLPGGLTRVRVDGLINDTWVACEISGPTADAADLSRRTDAWCVQVANAANSAR